MGNMKKCFHFWFSQFLPFFAISLHQAFSLDNPVHLEVFFRAADLKKLLLLQKIELKWTCTTSMSSPVSFITFHLLFHLFTPRQIPRSYFRDHDIRLENSNFNFLWCLHRLILWFLDSEQLEHCVIIWKDLIVQRENKLVLKPIDIIKDFTRDYVTAAKISQLSFLVYQFPTPMNSSCARGICNPKGKE